MSEQPVSTSGRAVAESAVTTFQSRLRGTLLRPGDNAYDSARKVFNAMIDRRPALIARCAGADDVVTCVQFARDHELPLAIRGGAHSVAGNAVCENGLVIDLSPMKGIEVDSTARVARAQSGLTLAEFDRETQRHGLATTLGTVSKTGIAGLTLGGGMGWLMSKHGLACDNLVAMDVVTAEGRKLRASDNENADLFWALRGGGGNFGVVTSFEYRLHQLGPVFGGSVVYPARDAATILKSYEQHARECPDELSTFAGFTSAPDGALVFAVFLCHCGVISDGQNAVRPFENLAKPIAVDLGPRSYLDIQRMFDEVFPDGKLHYWRSNFVRELSDRAIDVTIDFVRRVPSPSTLVAVQQMHGAASRVAPDATAFRHRYYLHNFMILSSWADPADSNRNINWTREFADAMRPMLERDLYVNDLGQEGEDMVRAAYGSNYERLVALKTKYDPTNFFRVNQNIRPG
jgi:FAD/FMN-containing dehydrogenase